MDAEALLRRIADDLEPHGVTVGMVFGKRALKAHGKAFACLHGDGLAIRLGAGTPEHARALELDGAHIFDPSERDRPFKDWVTVPVDSCAVWPELAEAGLARLTQPAP